MMKLCVLLVLCAVAIALQVHDVDAWSFSPPTLPLLPTMNDPSQFSFSTNFTCQADTVLVKCQVNLFTTELTDNFVDLSLGANSGVVSRYHELYGEVPLYNVSYFGTGLEDGQCGAVFSMATRMAFIYGCRGANAEGEWQDMNLILSHSLSAIPATISQLQVVAKPGDDVNILLHSRPMLYCMLELPLQSSQLVLWPESTVTTHRYYGASVYQGDCGVRLKNVTSADNGPVCLMGIGSAIQHAQMVSTLIIAEPPAEVSLSLDKLTYSEGDTLTATCSSLLSRPVANLTWTLDDRVIRQDAKRDGGLDEVWSWSWEKQNITQTLSLTLDAGHFGKKLECRVQHLDNVITNSDYVI